MNSKKMMPAMLLMMVLMIIALAFAWQGVGMHQKVGKEEVTFHKLQTDYFVLSKATREAAPDNAELNKTLVKIQNYPSELMRLKLLGVGKILTGIFVLLFGILIALIMMPIRLGKMLQK